MATTYSVRSLAIMLLMASTMTPASSVESSASEARIALGAARVIALHDGVAPGSEDWHHEDTVVEERGGPQVRHFVWPSLLYFPADKSAGSATILAPEGSNPTLVMSHGGVGIAERLYKSGIDAFISKHRLKRVGDGEDRAEPATFVARRVADLPCGLHVFQMGTHGFVNNGEEADHFMVRLVSWTRVNGWQPS